MLQHKVFDIETTGLDPYKGAEIFAYCIGDLDGNVEVYDGIAGLQEFFNDVNSTKICHNFHFELSFLKMAGIHIPEKAIWHDTMLMSQLLNNLAPSHALDELYRDYCDDEFDEVDKIVSQQARLRGNNYAKVDKKIMKQYQINDGIRTALLFQLFYPLVNKKDYKVEIELVKLTQKFEQRGIMLDTVETKKLLDFLEDEMYEVQKDVYNLYGEFININSDAHVSEILFKKLKLPYEKTTGTGKPATDKDVLLQLKSEYPDIKILDLIIKHRSYQKGHSIISGYLNLIDNNNIINPHIRTNKARTGREASQNPNLQNVSKEATLKNLYPVPARKCFRARDGYFLLFADYSGIEMRLIIDASKDKEMLKILADGGDPHAEATKIFFDIDEKHKRWKDYRSASKNAGFALAYGASPAKVAKTLGLPYEVVLKKYTLYAKRFPGVAGFSKSLIRLIYKQGYVETPFGRKLYVQLDKPYVSSNYLIQGTAAGILKRAQVAIDTYLLDKDIHILMPIHDEIVFEVSDKYKGDLQIIKELSVLMTDMPEITVKLDVEWKISNKNWFDAKELKV